MTVRMAWAINSHSRLQALFGALLAQQADVTISLEARLA